MIITCGIWSAEAQIVNPVKWSYAAKKTGKNEAVIYLKAEIEASWHIYSLYQPDGGPTKTTINFKKDASYSLVGKGVEPQPIKKYEDIYGIDVLYFSNSAVFSQKVKFTKLPFVAKGSVEFMVCNDKRCLPPSTVDFSVMVK